jgi:hypothetical protein
MKCTRWTQLIDRRLSHGAISGDVPHMRRRIIAFPVSKKKARRAEHSNSIISLFDVVVSIFEPEDREIENIRRYRDISILRPRNGGKPLSRYL